MSITAIIVTYNRKYDLIRCINAVLDQSKKVDTILIVNNASTDHTYEYLLEHFHCCAQFGKAVDEYFLLLNLNTISIYIVNKSKNTGGSGGFYTGLKIAHEKLMSDFYWLMDDDGYPSQNCLEILMTMVGQYNYIMPVSINIDDHTQLSWPTRKPNGKKTIFYDELKSSWGNIMNYVTPFNGVLLSNYCVSTVGYINKDFFLWGDEYEHYWRCIQKGIQPVTLLPACFYHPAQKLPLVKICFGLFQVPYVDSPLRMMCLARNYTYIYLHYNQKIKIPIKWVMYWWLFMITRRFDTDGWKRYKQSVKDGLKGDFTRHWQYVK